MRHERLDVERIVRKQRLLMLSTLVLPLQLDWGVPDDVAKLMEARFESADVAGSLILEHGDLKAMRVRHVLAACQPLELLGRIGIIRKAPPLRLGRLAHSDAIPAIGGTWPE